MTQETPTPDEAVKANSLTPDQIMQAVSAAADEHRRLFGILCACDPKLADDWKGPIRQKFSAQDFAERMGKAAEFMTGVPSKVTFSDVDEAWVLESIGYRAGPCGDH